MGRYRYDVQENCLIFKTPYPSIHLRPKFLHFLDLGCPILNEPPPPLPHPPQQTMEQQPHPGCERKKSKQKQNQFMSHLN